MRSRPSRCGKEGLLAPQLSLLRRLQLGLGLLCFLSLMGLAGVFAAERRAGAALERSHTALSLLDDFKQVQIELAAARAAEREFVLEDLHAPGFFQTGSSAALDRHAQATAALEPLLERLAGAPGAADLGVDEIRRAVVDYGASFAELVDLYRERGSLYTGVISRMRRASFDLQNLLAEVDSARKTSLRSELLELIADEGAYLRDLDNRPRFLVGERIEILREDVTAAAPKNAEDVQAQVSAYEQAWQRLLEIDDRIGRSSGDGVRGRLRGAEETVTVGVTAAVLRARDRFDDAAATVARTAAMARWVSGGGAGLTLAIALLLSVSLGRQIQGSLKAVLRAVEAYAGGDRRARVGKLPRQDEFGVLAESFDRMAETLAETTDELEEINASLELAVKGDTAGLLKRIKQLVAERKAPAA